MLHWEKQKWWESLLRMEGYLPRCFGIRDMTGIPWRKFY